MYLTLFLLAIFLACVAMLWNEGLWSNAITLINVLLAAIFASNYFEPVAAWLDGALPSYTYLWDFLALWLLFVISFGIMRVVTDLLSRTRVKFKMPVEHVGRVLLALWAAWIMISFTCFTLHTAPLPPNSFGGGFQPTPNSSNFLGLGPDRIWAAFMQSRSRGALSRVWDLREFDPNSEFILRYHDRRAVYAQEPELRVHR